MSRFNSPEEVAAWANSAAASDFKRHSKVHTNEDGSNWQVSLNPYCTPGMRNDWQRGFDNAPPRSWEGTREYDIAFQRGAAARRIVEAKQ